MQAFCGTARIADDKRKAAEFCENGAKAVASEATLTRLTAALDPQDRPTAIAARLVSATQLAPAVLGQDARDIAGLRQKLTKAFHIYGRNGPHVFALSALDIALWDIAGKVASKPVWQLLGGKERKTSVPAALEAVSCGCYAFLRSEYSKIDAGPRD